MVSFDSQSPILTRTSLPIVHPRSPVPAVLSCVQVQTGELERHAGAESPAHQRDAPASVGQEIVLATFDRQLCEAAKRSGLKAWPDQLSGATCEPEEPPDQEEGP